MTTKQRLDQSSLLLKLMMLCCLLLAAITSVWAVEEEFLAPEEAFQYELVGNDDGTLALNWTIAPDYYLYRKRMSVKATDDTVIQVDYPDGDIIHDEFFGESEVYYNQAKVSIEANGAQSLQIRWQGCADAGLCYPPQTAVIDIQDTLTKSGQSSLASALISNSTPSASLTNSRSMPASVPAQESETEATLIQTQDQAQNDVSAEVIVENNALSTNKSSNQLTARVDENVALAEDQRLAGQLAASSLWLNLAIFFGLGLLLSFTPCVLPMIPILSSVIVGAQVRKMRAFVLSLVFVLAMAVTYAVIGVAAALAGSSLQATLQQPLFIVPLVVIFVLLALSMFGLYELQLPLFIRQRLNKLNHAHKGGSLIGASVMGVLSALLASPCMTAPLAGALIYIADTGNAVYGGLTLLVLGLGMGAPLILMGTVGAALLPKPGAWMNQVKAIFGFILLGTAIWFLSRLIESYIHIALWGALLFALGISIYLSRYKLSERKPWDNILLVGSAVISLWGAIMMLGAAGGGQSFTQPLSVYSVGRANTSPNSALNPATNHLQFASLDTIEQLNINLAQAKTQGKWTLVDFYADWCVSCKIIESQVFTDPLVAESMAKMSLLRADITDYDADDKALMSALGILAPPAILIFDPQGNEVRANRVVGELSAEEFLPHLPKL